MRAAAVLPRLAELHEIRVLAAGDAYGMLAADYPIARVPNLRYRYGLDGRLSGWRTFKHNLSMGLDLLLHGPSVEMTVDVLREHNADIVISDGEPYSLRAAGILGIGRISFDNFAQLAYCRLALRGLDRIRCAATALGYRLLMGQAERIIIASFFDAPARRSGIQLVGPVIRSEVRETTPRRGEHVLVYFSKADEFTSEVEDALAGLEHPVRVYGTPHHKRNGNVQYFPIARQRFVEDLASCRAVIGTTGNQLLGEVLHFRKPMLGIPIACMEQRINAEALVQMGVGMCVRRQRLTAAVIREFLKREGEFLRNFPAKLRDGRSEALAAIAEFGSELRPPEAEPALAI